MFSSSMLNSNHENLQIWTRDSLAVSRDISYRSNSDILSYEDEDVVFLDKIDSPIQDGSFAMSILVENSLLYFRGLGVKLIAFSDIYDYLYNYPDMISLSRYVIELAVQSFDPNTELSLELYRDSESQYERLTLYVRLREYDKNIMGLIKRTRDEYRNIFPDVKGRFLLTTDFRFAR